LAKAGGRVVKNVAGYDLMKLFTGSYGTLGILTELTFRVYPIPSASATVVLVGEQEKIATATKTLLASALTPTAVDLLSTKLVNQLGFAQGMGLIVRFQSVTESVKEQSSRLLSVGEKLGLKGTIYNDDNEQLWQSLSEQIWNAPQKPVITCKIGVSPIAAVSALTQLEHITSAQGMGLIHGGSGLGLLQLDATVTAQTIMEMRRYCESKNGFLTILEAPATIKEQLDVWGYNGNALEIMRLLKQQFDPKTILSSNRFVGGI
ncbi:MAG: FAD-binding oxidoreductase, partial [Coleofasciculaceae cyanobacterium]